MYTCIDYSGWDFSGLGKNILPSLNETEKKIWHDALPFQDKRDDTGHAEFVAYFTLNLLESVAAKREIAIPAAILHDIGWSQLSAEEMAQFYLPNWRDFEPKLRAKHQEEGVKLARRLLEERCLEERLQNILEIISQHDTRKGFYSPEDGAVRDADKLWLFSVPCCLLSLKKRDFGKPLYSQLTEWLTKDGFLYSEISKDIARLELENSQSFLAKKGILIK